MPPPTGSLPQGPTARMRRRGEVMEPAQPPLSRGRQEGSRVGAAGLAPSGNGVEGVNSPLPALPGAMAVCEHEESAAAACAARAASCHPPPQPGASLHGSTPPSPPPPLKPLLVDYLKYGIWAGDVVQNGALSAEERSLRSVATATEQSLSLGTARRGLSSALSGVRPLRVLSAAPRSASFCGPGGGGEAAGAAGSSGEAVEKAKVRSSGSCHAQGGDAGGAASAADVAVRPPAVDELLSTASQSRPAQDTDDIDAMPFRHASTKAGTPAAAASLTAGATLPVRSVRSIGASSPLPGQPAAASAFSPAAAGEAEGSCTSRDAAPAAAQSSAVGSPAYGHAESGPAGSGQDFVDLPDLPDAGEPPDGPAAPPAPAPEPPAAPRPGGSAATSPQGLSSAARRDSLSSSPSLGGASPSRATPPPPRSRFSRLDPEDGGQPPSPERASADSCASGAWPYTKPPRTPLLSPGSAEGTPRGGPSALERALGSARRASRSAEESPPGGASPSISGRGGRLSAESLRLSLATPNPSAARPWWPSTPADGGAASSGSRSLESEGSSAGSATDESPFRALHSAAAAITSDEMT